MKAIKTYLLNLSKAFDEVTGEFEPAILLGPVVIAMIIAVIGAIYCGAHDQTFVWCLLKGILWGFYSFAFLNILWWGLFLAGVAVYTIVQSIGNWARKP